MNSTQSASPPPNDVATAVRLKTESTEGVDSSSIRYDVQESNTIQPQEEKVNLDPPATPQKIITATPVSNSDPSSVSIVPSVRRQQLAFNSMYLSVVSSVLIISALSEIVTSIIVVVTGGGRFTSGGLIIGFVCLATSGRGLFGNFTVEGPRTVFIMLFLSIIAVTTSVVETLDIYKSFQVADKNIHGVRICLNIGNTYSSCDALNVVYHYLKLSLYIAIGCCIFSFVTLLATIQILRNMIHVFRQRETTQRLSVRRNQAIRDLEAASLLGSDNNQGDEEISDPEQLSFIENDNPLPTPAMPSADKNQDTAVKEALVLPIIKIETAVDEAGIEMKSNYHV